MRAVSAFTCYYCPRKTSELIPHTASLVAPAEHEFGERDRGWSSFPELEGGNFEFSGAPEMNPFLQTRDSIGIPQFGGQKSPLLGVDFRGEFPPSTVRYV